MMALGRSPVSDFLSPVIGLSPGTNFLPPPEEVAGYPIKNIPSGVRLLSLAMVEQKLARIDIDRNCPSSARDGWG